MQLEPQAGLLDPRMMLITWLAMMVAAAAVSAWLIRLVVRAVRALEKRGGLADEVLMLSSRVEQQGRELAELRAEVRRLSGASTPASLRDHPRG